MFTTNPGRLEIFIATKNGRASALDDKLRKPFIDRVEEELQRHLERLQSRRDAIKTSDRFTPQGRTKELSALFRESLEQFKTFRAKIAKSLDQASAQQRSSVPTITTETADPNAQIVRQRRMKQLDTYFRSVDSLERGLRMRLALEDPTSTKSALLADTLREAEIIGLPIVERDAMVKFLNDLQDRANPELAQLRELRDAYDAMAELAINEVRLLAEEDRVDLSREVAAS